MYSYLNSAVISGVKAELVRVEIDISRGLPGFHIVGLAGKTVKESAKRVRSAIINSGFEWPIKKITVNLAPGNIQKYGSHFDLAIAAVLLECSGQIKIKAKANKIFAGELNLNGDLNKVKGVLAMLIEAEKKHLKEAVLAADNQRETALIENIDSYFLNNLAQLNNLTKVKNNYSANQAKIEANFNFKADYSELELIRGQKNAKKALITAAAGGHNLLFVGPPGCGKTILAASIVKLLKPLSSQELLETASIYSISDHLDKLNFKKRYRPFVAPHHSITAAGLIGGGRIAKAGEISLAHNGVLFLDELPEFKARILANLREPLERKKIKIVRQSGSYIFPANFQLIAAMNPCPCGYAGVKNKSCSCSERDIIKYQQKISGPLLDRIDLQIEMPALPSEEIFLKSTSKPLINNDYQIKNARIMQANRYQNSRIKNNSELELKDIEKYCKINRSSQKFLKDAVNKLNLSMRGYIRLMRVSRTIADLKAHPEIKKEDLIEAVDFRWFAENSQILL
ncbi:YifB family Mg chelatase-like AAA ATPase [Halanaerobium sp. Z-7514]|uniref:YifB family Mg chelatase-like AAA ATPase n=1 Tax=Halanaerobium polyolivorans TaxID=2886943 RepID=A0AAW4WZW4_9FIRM|nr:YifB family Mg chelatase-like AAA ATPase [Halanaerobium polyolivorans]MCC3143806.1 YifB family Mg chelatase-like AAA ATPase [Halanaerobium polyolivorans]